MKKLNSRGMLDAPLLIALAVVIIVGGLVLFRISSASNDQTRSDSAENIELVDETNSDASTQEGVEKIEEAEEANKGGGDVPANDGSGDIETPGVSTNPDRKTNSDDSVSAFKYSENDSQTSVEISFKKGGANFDGNNVNASATLESEQEGICYYTFRNGNTTVSKSNNLKNNKTCSINVPLNQFPKSGNYLVDFGFINYNRSVIANIANIPLDIAL